MPSNTESIVANGVALNDQTTFVLEELVYKPAEKKSLWAANPNASGDALVTESQYTNSYFEATVRVVPAASTDAALKALGELTDALQGCEGIEGGGEGTWTPNNASTTYGFYTLVGEFVEIPITVEGQLAGWFVKSPIVKIKLTNRPFLYTEERTVLEAVESGAEPLQTAYLEGVKGDVPAEGRLILTDKATQDRRYAEWGLEQLASKEGNPSLLLTAASLVVTGFAGESTTRSGAYSEEKVKRLKTTPVALTFCGTGAIKHIGSYRLRARIYAESEDIRIRASYRNGAGPLRSLEWVEPPFEDEWADVDLGEVTFEEVEQGEQRGEILFDGRTVGTAEQKLDLNYLTLVPTTVGHVVARGPIFPLIQPTTFKARSEFDTESGAITGDSLAVGGIWVGAGDAVDFSVAAGVATRSETKDDAGIENGRLITASTPSLALCAARVDLKASAIFAELTMGLLLRYVDTSNFLATYLLYGTSGYKYRVDKRVAGVTTIIASESLPTLTADTYYTLTAMVTANGRLSAWLNPQGTLLSALGTPSIVGTDSVLATGGALATGAVGIIDQYRLSSEASVRTYDNFAAWIPEIRPVTYSTRKAEFNTVQAEMADAEGKYWGPVPFARGGRFYIPAAGKENSVSRLAARARRLDIEAESDTSVTDKQSLEVLARERWLAPR